MENDIPDLNSFAGIIEHDVPYSVALEYELWVLKQMGWKLNGNIFFVDAIDAPLMRITFAARTPLAFLQCYCCLGVVFPSDTVEGNMRCGVDTIMTILQKQFSLLSTLCVLDQRFKAYPASLTASAILYVSRKKLSLRDPWSDDLSHITCSVPEAFMHIVELLESASEDILAQVAPAMAALTMSVSPVKVPPQKEGSSISKASGIAGTLFTPQSKDVAEALKRDESPYSVTQI